MQKLLVFKMKLPKFKNSWGYENNFLSNKILIILFYADNLLIKLNSQYIFS
jgi:hypothetical protein